MFIKTGYQKTSIGMYFCLFFWYPVFRCLLLTENRIRYHLFWSRDCKKNRYRSLYHHFPFYYHKKVTYCWKTTTCWISTELSKKGKRKRLNSYEVGLLQFSFSVSHFQFFRYLGSVSYRVMLVVQFYSFEMSNNQVRAKNASFDIQGFGDSNKE